MSERLLNLLMILSVACALVVTGLLIRREQAELPADREWVIVGDVSPIAESAPHRSGEGATGPLIVEFFDFECPACKQLAEAVDSVRRSTHPNLRIARHHYPLTRIHPMAQDLALVALCLPGDAAFEHYHKRAFELQGVLTSDGAVTPMSLVPAAVDTSEVRSCMRRPETWKRLQRGIILGDSLRIRATPSFIIGDRLYTGSRTAEQLSRLLGDSE